MMRQLDALRAAVSDARRQRGTVSAGPDNSAEEPTGPPEALELYDTQFELGDRLDYSYEMDAIDLADNLRNIRQGKQHSDFLIFAIHAHQEGLGYDEIADFLPELAHAAIEAGADAVIPTGKHRLRPIEIYQGRPIFYGLGDFFWEEIQDPIGADYYEYYQGELDSLFGDYRQATDADIFAVISGAGSGFDDELVYESVIPVSRFEGGRLVELRLYPVDLGYGKRLTESGIPALASPEIALKILTCLQRMSAPFGTQIEIEGNTGVIRP